MPKTVKIDKFSKELKAQLEKAKAEITKKEFLTEIAEDLADQIKLRTRLGSGVSKQGANSSKLKPLSSQYKEQRKKDKSKGALSSETSPSKSNLTRTGEMLNSITTAVTKESITLSFKDQANKDKARWNKEKGRPFFEVSKTEIKRIRDKVESVIQKYLKK